MASMHNKPSVFVAAVHEDKIYVRSEYSLEVYDPATNVWTDLGKPNIKGRFGPTALLSMNGQLVALCVESTAMRDVSPPRHVCRFASSTNQFTPLFEMARFIIFEKRLYSPHGGCSAVVGAFH